MKGVCNIIRYRYRLHHGNCFKKRVWKQRKHFFGTRVVDRWDELYAKAVLATGASVIGVIWMPSTIIYCTRVLQLQTHFQFDFLKSRPIERVVLNRINIQESWHGLRILKQSACLEFHSFEIALVDANSCILSALGNGKVTALTFLDLSQAFDTKDDTNPSPVHSPERFGISGFGFRLV